MGRNLATLRDILEVLKVTNFSTAFRFLRYEAYAVVRAVRRRDLRMPLFRYQVSIAHQPAGMDRTCLRLLRQKLIFFR